MNFLRQSTAVDIAIGPFVDATDGVTAETGLTISQADVRLKKNNGAWAQVNDNTSATHEENGWYEKELDATDTNTVGILIVAVAESGALPVWHEFQVLEEAVYDALFAASAAGYGTAQTGDSFARLGAPVGASISADVAGVQSDTNDIQTRLPAALVGGRMDANMGAVSGDATAADNIETAFDDTAGAVPWQGIVDQGTAQSATATTIVLRSGAAFADDELIGATILVTGGSAGVGQSRVIADYVGATDTATVETWSTTPSGTITYKIYGTAPSSGGGGLDAAGVRAAIGMASANMDTQLSGLDTKLDTIDNFVDTEVAALTTELAKVPKSDSNVTWNATALASIQSEATDALNAYDPPTRAELTTDTNSVLSAVGDVPTNAELATALAGADDAVLAAIGALNNISVANILAATVEGSTTLVQTLRLLNAALGGKASGLETTTAVYRDIGDTKDRITATVDVDGNRSAVTLDLT
jgi:hypothetical protein